MAKRKMNMVNPSVPVPPGVVRVIFSKEGRHGGKSPDRDAKDFPTRAEAIAWLLDWGYTSSVPGEYVKAGAWPARIED